MKNKLESISSSKTGSVKIGVVATAKYFAHKIIAGFITLNPDINDRLQAGDWLIFAGKDELIDQIEIAD